MIAYKNYGSKEISAKEMIQEPFNQGLFDCQCKDCPKGFYAKGHHDCLWLKVEDITIIQGIKLSTKFPKDNISNPFRLSNLMMFAFEGTAQLLVWGTLFVSNIILDIDGQTLLLCVSHSNTFTHIALSYPEQFWKRFFQNSSISAQFQIFNHKSKPTFHFCLVLLNTHLKLILHPLNAVYLLLHANPCLI